MRKFLKIYIGLSFIFSFCFAFSLNSTDPTELYAAIFYYSQTKNPIYIDKFCNFLLNSANRKIKIASAQALGNYQNNTKSLKCLLKAYRQEKDIKVKKEILLNLIGFENENVTKFFCKVLNSTKDENLKSIAISGLMKNPKVCLNLLKKYLYNSNNPHFQAKILKIFALYKIKVDEKLLLKFLNSSNKDLKVAALKYYLYNPPSKEIVENIKNIFENDLDPQVKALALEVLLENSNLVEEDYLNFALSDEDIRKRIAYRLPFLKNKNLPLSTLNIFLNDKRDFIKIAALTYIGNSKNKKYCLFLKNFIYKPISENVKEAYLWAISKLNCPYALDYLIMTISNLQNNDNLRLAAARFLKFIDKKALEKNKLKLKFLYEKEGLDDIKSYIKDILDNIQKGEKRKHEQKTKVR